MTHDTMASLDSQIAERHILKHPFYLAWTEGTLTTEALRSYAGQYYQHVKAFPTYISALHSHCQDIETRQTLLKNLRDEEEGVDNHPALWLRFAEAVGCSAEEAEAVTMEPETAGAIEAFQLAMREGSVTRGLAALYAYESMVPEVAAEKIRGLAEHYGVDGSPGTDYFEVHKTLDIEHAGETKELLADRIDTPEDAEEARIGTAIALEAVNSILDGVCRVNGIAKAA